MLRKEIQMQFPALWILTTLSLQVSMLVIGSGRLSRQTPVNILAGKSCRPGPTGL